MRASASGATVSQVTVSYSGPQSGSITLVSSGGRWVGQLPDTLPSGTYTLRAKARAGSKEEESSSVTFLLDLIAPELELLEPTGPVTLGAGSLTLRVRPGTTWE